MVEDEEEALDRMVKDGYKTADGSSHSGEADSDSDEADSDSDEADSLEEDN